MEMSAAQSQLTLASISDHVLLSLSLSQRPTMFPHDALWGEFLSNKKMRSHSGPRMCRRALSGFYAAVCQVFPGFIMRPFPFNLSRCRLTQNTENMIYAHYSKDCEHTAQFRFIFPISPFVFILKIWCLHFPLTFAFFIYFFKIWKTNNNNNNFK